MLLGCILCISVHSGAELQTRGLHQIGLGSYSPASHCQTPSSDAETYRDGTELPVNIGGKPRFEASLGAEPQRSLLANVHVGSALPLTAAS